ncbi:MAG: mercuric reductase [Myxococcales bacterium]|nr:mercuric reductase [Myxococcales bacterium]
MTEVPFSPVDDADWRLLHTLRPTDWQNPTPNGTYNLVVLGGGTAGLVCAVGAAGLGAKVALVERHLLGGDCLNFGCVPSKALLAAAHGAFAARNQFAPAGDASAQPDFGAAMAWVRERRAKLAPHDGAARVSGEGVDVFLGAGRFTAPDRISVGDTELSFKKAVIATGGRAGVPPIDGLEGVPYLTNETVFSLTEAPRHLLVIGAGPIGCELSQAMRRLGCEVTLLDRDARILPKDDERAANILLETLTREGVRVTLHVDILSAAVAPNASSSDGVRLAIRSRDSGEERAIEGSHLLIAAGRVPNVKDIGLEVAGVAFDERKGITVDDQLCTTNSNIYAAGDVASPLQFTHMADAMARNVLRNAFFFGHAKTSSLVVPWATYTDPEVAHVGVTHQQAEAEGLESLEVDLSSLDRAILEGIEQGFARAYYDGKGHVRGATIVAPRAGDLIGELTLAVTHGMTLGQLASVIHPYPSQGEISKKLGDAYMRTRLTPRVKGLFERWFRFLRR